MPMRKELRALWIKAGYPGYPNEMGSAEVCPPPPDDVLRVYHFMAPEHAISSIALGRLKLARFTDVNDPFELMALRIRGKLLKKAVSDFKNAFDSHTGMLCFSGNWVSPVLWSHYAARHRGVCLGFNLKRSLGEQVKYEDERIPSGLDNVESIEDLSEEIRRRLLCTKFSHWRYENEVRVFVELSHAVAEGGLYFQAFDQDLVLAEVILGENCPLPLDHVRRFVGAFYPNAIVFKARLAVNSFHVVPKEKTVP